MLKVRKNKESINPVISKIITEGTMILSKYAICSSKKPRFVKKQEPKGLLSNVGFRTPFNKIPILVDAFF